MERRIRAELLKMTIVMAVMIGVGIYAHDFVIAGIKAKVALNSSIFALFSVAAFLAFRSVLGLKNEVLALKALQVDYGMRGHEDLSTCDRPAILFREPQLLGAGYRLITERLAQEKHLRLPSKVVESLVHSVDQRINERKSVVIYFSGLMVFMGLIGAFMGLMHTVGSVGDLIGGMDVSGKAGNDSFGKMIEGMKAPLRGMSVGFSSSLFGLSTSMVLGALERCMTTAAKVLRDEFEHWLSLLTELEGASAEGTAEADGQSGVVARAIAMASRQLAALQAAVETGQQQDVRTQQALAGLYGSMAELTRTVDRVSDPTPVIAPIAATVTDLARNQIRLSAEMELIVAHAREDRAHIRETLDALRAGAADRTQDRDREVHAIVARLDRLVASSEAALERDPVTINWPESSQQDDRRQARGARALQTRLAEAIGTFRLRGRVEQDLRRLSGEVAVSLERQEALHEQVRYEMTRLRNGLAADRENTAAILHGLEIERERLVALAGLLDAGDAPLDMIAALDRARVQLDVLSARAARLHTDSDRHDEQQGRRA